MFSSLFYTDIAQALSFSPPSLDVVLTALAVGIIGLFTR